MVHLFTHINYVHGLITVFVWQYCQYGWELCGALVYPCKVVRGALCEPLCMGWLERGRGGPVSFIAQCLQAKTEGTGQ